MRMDIGSGFALVRREGKIFVKEIFNEREGDMVEVGVAGWTSRLRERYPGRVDEKEVASLLETARKHLR